MKGVLQIPTLPRAPNPNNPTPCTNPTFLGSVPLPVWPLWRATPCGASNPQRCEYNPRRRSKRIFTPQKGTVHAAFGRVIIETRMIRAEFDCTRR